MRSRRSDFPLLMANPSLHYLDSAATTQKPAVVLDAIRAYYEHDNANPHRGAYALSVRATERYHGARERIARFIDLLTVQRAARDPNESPAPASAADLGSLEVFSGVSRFPHRVKCATMAWHALHSALREAVASAPGA